MRFLVLILTVAALALASCETSPYQNLPNICQQGQSCSTGGDSAS